MELIEKNACTGCMACADVCPKKAIIIQPDACGFLYPEINKDICIDCGLCQSVCPVKDSFKNKKNRRIYACWNKDASKRFSATSGGTFLVLAGHIIKSGGVVYGAAFDEQYKLRHQKVDTVEQLPILSGSKYVQSNTQNIFSDVKSELESGKKVLFSGTPCQVSALKKYLKKDYESLYCVDLVCHGVPSPKVFEDYLNYQREKNDGAEPVSINFRYKKPCWSVYSMKINFDNKNVYESSKFRDPYLMLFLSDLNLRPSCFECRFTSLDRPGDITLGDFWGFLTVKKSQRDIEKGTGLVLVNTEKGEELLNASSDELHLEKHYEFEALRSNQSFKKPWRKPEKYDEFWSDYSVMAFSEIAEKYCIYDESAEKRKYQEAMQRAEHYKKPFSRIKYSLRVLKNSLG